jgi:uncharacterized protein with HEPN domain
MPRDPKEMARLWDMLDAARAAVLYTGGITFDEFMRDRKTRDAVERNLEIIGEAARHISPQTRAREADIPWKPIIGLRNIIAHESAETGYQS